MNYPKLLIINSDSFNDYKGGGITLRNLFLGWPKDKIAIAHTSDSKPMTNVCEKYFKIGYNESQYIFPINRISKEPHGRLNGPYSIYDFNKVNDTENNRVIKDQSHSENSIKQWGLKLIAEIGIYEFIHPIKISSAFKEWILEYNPEIIYCQPSNISFINLILNAHTLTKAKIVIHVMDDWPYLIYKDKTFSFFLRGIVNRNFQKLIDISYLRLGISKAMANEFQTRYNQPFKYFHNPVDVSVPNLTKSSEKYGNKSFLLVYSGRIGWTASHDSIIEICQCIQQLRKEGLNICFNIYTDLNDKENDFSQFKFDGASLLPALKDDNFIIKLQEADLLLYPVDFDQKSIEFIRLSFPTKLPSYLISGTPVFCYGPATVHSIRFMTENQLGFVCVRQEINEVKAAIREALTNQAKRADLSNRALIYAKANFDAIKVRSSFHQEIANCLIRD